MIKKKRHTTEDAPRKRVVDEDQLNVNSMMEDYSSLNTSGEYLTLKDGDNRVRFMMNIGGGNFYVLRKTTYVPFGGGRDKGRSLISARGKDAAAYCPLNTVADALHAIANDTTARGKSAAALRNAIRPRAQFLSNCLINEGRQYKQGVLQYGQSVAKQIMESTKHMLDEDDVDDKGYTTDGNIAHSKTGKIIVIARKGSKLNTEYSVTILSKALPVTKEQLAARMDLSRHCKPSDPQEIEDVLCQWFGKDSIDDILEGIADGDPLPSPKEPLGKPRKARASADEDDEDEEDAPRRKKHATKPAAKKKSRDRVYDDEDEEDETEDYNDYEDDEEEEDERPARKKKPAAKRAVADDSEDEEDDEDDEEEDDSDDDEEEEAPRKKKPVGKTTAKKRAPVVDDEDEDEDEEEEDPRPRRKVRK